MALPSSQPHPSQPSAVTCPLHLCSHRQAPWGSPSTKAQVAKELETNLRQQDPSREAEGGKDNTALSSQLLLTLQVVRPALEQRGWEPCSPKAFWKGKTHCACLAVNTSVSCKGQLQRAPCISGCSCDQMRRGNTVQWCRL